MQTEKYCKICDEMKPSSDFYKRTNGKLAGCICIPCHREKENAKNHAMEADLQRVLQAPNSYTCDKQRRDTFNIMISLGWTFHKSSGIWYKPGIKNKYGLWDNLSNDNIPRKYCSTCEKLLPVTNFYYSKTYNYYQSVCIDCKRIYRRIYYAVKHK